MDLLTFISKLIEAIAWPLTVIILLLLLRRPLTVIIPQMRKLKYKDFEAQFGSEVQEVKALAKVALPESTGESFPAEQDFSAVRLLGISPNAAVLEAWKEVEFAAKGVIERYGIHLNYEVSTPYKLIERTLEKSCAIEPRKLKIFSDLRKLRNKVAHTEDFEISEENAAEYVRLAKLLADYFNGVKK